MSKALQTTLIVFTILIGAAALVWIGLNFTHFWWNPLANWHTGMMGGYGWHDGYQVPWDRGSIAPRDAYGITGMGRMDDGMGIWGTGSTQQTEPLSLTEAQSAVQNYLNALGNGGLVLGEIMIFDNHAYAEIIEQDTGMGAMEVLVDPITKVVYPEPGPNMMWNLKYSPMSVMGTMGGYGYSVPGGSMGGMMGGQYDRNPSSEMSIAPEEAAQIAQRYLDRYAPGSDASEEVDPFYGYYTIHILQDGSTAGMLSVNGYTGEVFVHTWHGTLIEISEDH